MKVFQSLFTKSNFLLLVLGSLLAIAATGLDTFQALAYGFNGTLDKETTELIDVSSTSTNPNALSYVYSFSTDSVVDTSSLPFNYLRVILYQQLVLVKIKEATRTVSAFTPINQQMATFYLAHQHEVVDSSFL